MKINKFLIAALVLTISFTACKNDKEEIEKEIKTEEKETEKEEDTQQGTNPTDKLCINEVYTLNPDWIELYNGSDKEIDLSGFILQDEDENKKEKEFIIPENTIIASKGFVVFHQAPKGEEGTKDQFKFGLGAKKDKVILLNKERVVIDQIDTPEFEKEGKQSYARKVDGGSEWAIVDTPTPGKTNGAAS